MYKTIPNRAVDTAVNIGTALAECTPVHCRDWQLKMKTDHEHVHIKCVLLFKWLFVVASLVTFCSTLP